MASNRINRINEEIQKELSGLLPSKPPSAAHLPLHRGGFCAVQNRKYALH